MADYTLNNPDTLTKYKTAAQISQKVLEAVTKLCAADEKIVTICERGDKLLEEEIGKVYRGKKIAKGSYSLCSSSPAFPYLKWSLCGNANGLPRHIAPNHSFTLFFRNTLYSFEDG
jgi:hypothetical protein